MEDFVVKHYSEDEAPTFKGNGFDGIRVGEDREEAQRLADCINALRKDAERYRWLRDSNSHHLHNSAWIASLTAVKDGPCDIFSADEVPALLDAEIDRRMARAPAVGAA